MCRRLLRSAQSRCGPPNTACSRGRPARRYTGVPSRLRSRRRVDLARARTALSATTRAAAPRFTAGRRAVQLPFVAGHGLAAGRARWRRCNPRSLWPMCPRGLIAHALTRSLPLPPPPCPIPPTVSQCVSLSLSPFTGAGASGGPSSPPGDGAAPASSPDVDARNIITEIHSPERAPSTQLRSLSALLRGRCSAACKGGDVWRGQYCINYFSHADHAGRAPSIDASNHSPVGRLAHISHVAAGQVLTRHSPDRVR